MYRNIDRKFEDISSKLDQIHIELEAIYSENLRKYLDTPEKEHQLLLKQKELYWKQRSRIKWLKEGDNNTKFFHTFANNCIRRNMIQSKKIDNNWIYEMNDIKKILIDHCKNLYTSNNNRNFSFQNVWCEQISNEEGLILTQQIMKDEITKALIELDRKRLQVLMGLMHSFSEHTGTS